MVDSECYPPASWMLNGSCHNPLIEFDAEYLKNNPVDWREILKASILFILSLLTKLCFLLSINMITVSW